jgi:hypothetical protein
VRQGKEIREEELSEEQEVHLLKVIKRVLMGDSSYGRNFDLDKKNEIQHHT